MAFVSVVAVMAVFVCGANSMNSARNAVANPDMPICSNQRPCDMTIGHMTTGGSLSTVLSEEAMCACRETQCPVGWQQDGSKTITIQLATRPSTVLAQFHYCTDISAFRICQDSEVAMKTQANGIYPQRINDFICKCPHNGPMVLKKTKYIPMRYRFEHEYTCELPVCEVSQTEPQVCMVSRRKLFGIITTYICDCPEGFQCLQQGRSGRGLCLSA